MARVLAHWGPDDFAYLYASTLTGKVHLTQDEHTDFAPNVFLAHRRLAVTDLSTAGRQPMSNEAGDIFVVFNGAIHNYIELRAEESTVDVADNGGFRNVLRRHVTGNRKLQR